MLKLKKKALNHFGGNMETRIDSWHLPNTFEYQGRQVKYGIEGKGEPLILVHGTPWSSFNYRHLIEYLSPHYQVYYFDLLGYGESDKSNADVSLGIQNKLLGALIEHWEIEQPLIIGHDFGGTTVLRSHLLDKIEYNKIVLIDPVAKSPWGSPFFIHIANHESAFADVPDYIHAAIVEAYVKTAAYQTINQETLNGILAPWISAEGKSAFYRQIAQADSKFTDDFQDKFVDVKTPVLILWGEQDQWIPCEQAYSLQNEIPKSKLVTIPDAGHLVIEEKSDFLTDEILSFFS